MKKDTTPGQRAAAQAEALIAQNRFAEAEPLARRCLAAVESYVAAQPQAYALLLAAVSLLGSALQGQERYPEASALYQNCLDGLPDTLRRDPPSHYLEIVAHYAHCLRCEDRPEQALQLLETTIPLARGMVHRRVVNQSLYADLLEYQAKVYFEQADLDRGNLDAAAASVLDAVECRRLVADRDPALRFQSVPTLVVAACIQGERRHYDAAYALAVQAREAYRAATRLRDVLPTALRFARPTTSCATCTISIPRRLALPSAAYVPARAATAHGRPSPTWSLSSKPGIMEAYAKLRLD